MKSWTLRKRPFLLHCAPPPLTHGEILRVGKEAHIYHVLSFQKAVKLRARVLELMYLCRGIIIVSFFQMMIYL